jgi:hypothetical protein
VLVHKPTIAEVEMKALTLAHMFQRMAGQEGLSLVAEGQAEEQLSLKGSE